MNNKDVRRVIVVLGMHRSGTSAIARGLKVFGVDLGDNLMPAAEHDNPKGYWEDIDIYQLDVEILNFLNNDWHLLTPIQLEDVDMLRRNGYFLRAAELLRKKMANGQIFGFKDPRVAKLLPFWKEVFAYDQLKISYLIVIRHPLSVCKSLAKRLGFEHEKSYFLWLEHVINSFAGTDGENRVVVDYDRLMKSPETELARVGRAFQLEINNSELEKFKVEFLDRELQHTVYQIGDLNLDKAVPPLVKEVYSKALDIASDGSQMEDITFSNRVQRWSNELSRSKSLLMFADKLESRLAERELAAQSLATQLTEREQAVQTLNRQVAEREQAVQMLNRQVAEREQAVQTLTGQEQLLIKRVAQREQVVKTVTGQLVEREQVIQSLTNQVAEREQTIQGLTGQLAEREQVVQSLSNQLVEIYGSKKWKFALFLSRIRIALAPENSFRFRVLRSLYRSILFLTKPNQSQFTPKEPIVSDPGKADAPEIQKVVAAEAIAPSQDHAKLSNNLDGIIQERFPDLCPLLGFKVPESGVRLNMVTDSINSGSLFGGVGTAINLSALLAQKWGCDLRLITRTEPANKENFKNILDFNGISCPQNVEFAFAHIMNSNAEIPVKDGDVFLTTSWWTTWSVRETFGSQKIIYLLQEDERSFYSFGDERFFCSEVLSDPKIRYIVNTRLLYDYFVEDGLRNIHENGLWFEPSFPKSLFFYEKRENQTKNNFFFYARPNNFRNLYLLGLQVINEAVAEGILNPMEWDFYFVGKDLPKERLSAFYNSVTAENLGWSEYSTLVRKMDLGLSLMYSPHPSYPPLDLAASGSIVVTNSYGPKQNLDQYSKNIICRNLTLRDLVGGIRDGVELTRNIELRQQNYEQNCLNRDWHISFEEILKKLDKEMFNVSP